jgi:hypothetical protein
MQIDRSLPQTAATMRTMFARPALVAAIEQGTHSTVRLPNGLGGDGPVSPPPHRLDEGGDSKRPVCCENGGCVMVSKPFSPLRSFLPT